MRVILAAEMAAAIFQTESESVMIREMDNPLSVIQQCVKAFHGVRPQSFRHTKKTQLMKILPAVYIDCRTVANAQVQQQAQLNAYNNLLNAKRTGTDTVVVPPPLDIRSLEATYSQLMHHMKSSFNICVSTSQ